MSSGYTKGDFAVFLDAYPFEQPWKAVKEESGMNNTTRIVYTGDKKYVLRVYDNHRDAGIVQIEHMLLAELQKSELPYRVPQPITNRDGSTITSSADGKLAALYDYIDGERPSALVESHIEGLGRAAGTLSQAMQRLMTDSCVEPLHKPYYELEQSQAVTSNAVLLDLSASSERLSKRKQELHLLIDERARLSSMRSAFAALPHQWIHGDIVFTNALVHEEHITGLLDFEFCTVDLRAMELAVVLAEFPETDSERAIEKLSLFCRGFGSMVKLSEAEINLLSDLIKLRMLDVFLHFAGRLAEGLDEEHIWDEQIARASFVCSWLDLHKKELDCLFYSYLYEVEDHCYQALS
ncbi:hypothetical protein Back11_12800 [Paenibacillus baekrokdamisoli]|uniref:Uncharacterized protein n=1 Tax=Paenibacillus baekrokdamisoli TaxID=1712516 RepID=A0A3G9IV31_9BACL|nr:phosphotransferase [Paenibacillus baekrokdamisoli]MBB3070584.1 homoserine kinase type II [Paenibacillus baekrokdamisoli]BBH19935.1 hypothetical protein Back11_12800 [Paenibacillus baekrokdamisoli]